MVVVLMLLTFQSAIGLLFPLGAGQLLAAVLQKNSYFQLNTIIIGLAVLSFTQATITILQSYQLNYIGESIILDLRTSLYKQLLHLSLKFHLEHRVGELVSRITGDSTQIRGVLTNNLTQLYIQTTTLIGSIAIVFTLNPRLTFLVLILAPSLIGTSILFGRSFQALSKQMQDATAAATIVVEEGLQGIRVVKCFTREAHEVGRYNNALKQSFRIILRITILRSLFGLVLSFLGFATISVMLWFIAREVIDQRMGLAQISSFLIYSLSIATNLGGLAGQYSQFRETIGALQGSVIRFSRRPGILNGGFATHY
jgi:subfamily B ATP-binding cassette protein MsbA